MFKKILFGITLYAINSINQVYAFDLIPQLKIDHSPIDLTDIEKLIQKTTDIIKIDDQKNIRNKTTEKYGKNSAHRGNRIGRNNWGINGFKKRMEKMEQIRRKHRMEKKLDNSLKKNNGLVVMIQATLQNDPNKTNIWEQNATKTKDIPMGWRKINEMDQRREIKEKKIEIDLNKEFEQLIKNIQKTVEVNMKKIDEKK